MLSDETQVWRSSFVLLHDRGSARFGTLLGAFVRLRRSSVPALASHAGVKVAHVEACMYLKTVPGPDLREAFVAVLGFDPWSVVRPSNHEPSCSHPEGNATHDPG